MAPNVQTLKYLTPATDVLEGVPLLDDDEVFVHRPDEPVVAHRPVDKVLGDLQP